MSIYHEDATKKRKNIEYTVGLEQAIKKIAIREQRSVNGQIVFILEQFVMEWRGWPVELVEKSREGEKSDE